MDLRFGACRSATGAASRSWPLVKGVLQSLLKTLTAWHLIKLTLHLSACVPMRASHLKAR